MVEEEDREDDREYGGPSKDPRDRYRSRRRRYFDPFDDPFFDTDLDREFERMRKYMDRIVGMTMQGRAGDGSFENPFIYGFTMRTGADGKPHFQEFGNTNRVRRLNSDPQVRDREMRGQTQGVMGGREPLTDVIDCEGTIAITVELPGVDKKDIQLEVLDDRLSIKVDTEDRRYYKEVELPGPVKDDSTKASYNNGVLEVTLEKTASKKKKGKRVTIE